MTGYITPRTFRFFRELARHNDREWFEANKRRYIEEVRDPLVRFIEAFGPKLARISGHMVADPRARRRSAADPARLRPRASPRRGPEAPELHHDHQLHREGGRRARVPRPVRAGVPARHPPDAIPDGRRRAPVVASTQSTHHPPRLSLDGAGESGD